jgi:adenylate kinase
MSHILIGGTPGTGKTLTARKLGLNLGLEVVSLFELARQNDCITDHDESRNTGVIDEDCLVEVMLEELEKRKDCLIIEGHYIDLVPSKTVRFAFVLRTHPAVLRDRLNERDYSPEKVKENVEAEVIGVCQLDAIYSFGEDLVYEVNNTSLTLDETVETILSIINDKTPTERIDWMQDFEGDGSIDEFLDQS